MIQVETLSDRPKTMQKSTQRIHESNILKLTHHGTVRAKRKAHTSSPPIFVQVRSGAETHVVSCQPLPHLRTQGHPGSALPLTESDRLQQSCFFGPGDPDMVENTTWLWDFSIRLKVPPNANFRCFLKVHVLAYLTNNISWNSSLELRERALQIFRDFSLILLTFWWMFCEFARKWWPNPLVGHQCTSDCPWMFRMINRRFPASFAWRMQFFVEFGAFSSRVGLFVLRMLYKHNTSHDPHSRAVIEICTHTYKVNTFQKTPINTLTREFPSHFMGLAHSASNRFVAGLIPGQSDHF